MFLLIENEGVAPIEAFTMLGDSGTRHRGNDGLIGQFGSGNKHAINLLLRKNIPFYIYSGQNKLEFYFEVAYVKEADGSRRESYPVKCRVSGKTNRTIDCGWTLEFGALDWTEVRMALREFVSNALDCSLVMGSQAVVRPEPKNRAKAGTTRIFVSLASQEVKEFYRDLGKYFLHFSDDPSQVNKTFIKKNPDSVGPRVYREGVFVAELRGNKPSAFDYNFKSNEIRIDECRNSDEYVLRARIAQLINRADKDTLAGFFEKLSNEELYESTLDEFYLNYSDSQSHKDNWLGAWASFAGDAVIATESMMDSPILQHVQAKGHKTKVVRSESFVKVARSMGVKDVASVLGKHATDGKIECEPTKAALEAVSTVWEWCERENMTNRKPMPIVGCFRQIMDGEKECLGYHELGTNKVFLREDIAGKIALKVALEEVAHYITGSGDCSRDFQNFAFDMIVELCT